MLNSALRKIRDKKVINAKLVDGYLNSIGSKLSDIGSLVHVKRDLYLVNVSNPSFLDELISMSDPTKSRVDATIRLKDSHKHGTHTAYFFCKRVSDQSSVNAIFCGPDTDISYLWPDASEQSIILVENSDCFTFSERFLNVMGLDSIECDTLIIWSSGRNITHSQALRLLSVYKSIYYCPDYDLAGVEIFESLSKHLGSKISFCMPPDLERFSAFCKQPDNKLHYTKALKKAQTHGFTPMVTLLVKGRGILEQEALLFDAQT